MTNVKRRLILHIGTPKTGTTSLQIALGDNTQALRERAILVPIATRGATPWVGAHHGIVLALLEPDAAADGERIADLIAELDASALPLAIVSSETLCALYRTPDLLARFAASLAAIDYDATVILYVREQSAFAESVYAEFAKQGSAWDANAYLDAVVERDPRTVATGWSFAFDYTIIVDAFAMAFGAENVIVRPYRALAPTDALAKDFCGAAGLPRQDAAYFTPDARRPNARSTFLDILTRLRANATSRPTHAASVSELLREVGVDEHSARDRPFAMLDSGDVSRIATAFGAANRRLFERCGVRIEREESDAAAVDVDAFKRALAAASIAWNLDRSF